MTCEAVKLWKSFTEMISSKVGSDIFETGFPPARFAAVWPLTLLAFGRFKQILLEEPPVQCNLDPFLAGQLITPKITYEKNLGCGENLITWMSQGFGILPVV